MGTAEGIIAANDPTKLSVNGGHIKITKAWVKSLFKRMHYVKHKCSNAGKVCISQLKEVFLADIRAEVQMNDIPDALIFNWDQTPLHLVPTGQWTMNKEKEKVIPIAHSDDKRQITAVFAVTLSGVATHGHARARTGTCQCYTNYNSLFNLHVLFSTHVVSCLTN